MQSSDKSLNSFKTMFSKKKNIIGSYSLVIKNLRSLKAMFSKKKKKRKEIK